MKPKNPTGFVNPQSISYVAYLEKEFAKEDAKKQSNRPILSEDELNELTRIKNENNDLKQELNQIKEALKNLNIK